MKRGGTRDREGGREEGGYRDKEDGRGKVEEGRGGRGEERKGRGEGRKWGTSPPSSKQIRLTCREVLTIEQSHRTYRDTSRVEYAAHQKPPDTRNDVDAQNPQPTRTKP
jgi:hypothetical protein